MKSLYFIILIIFSFFALTSYAIEDLLSLQNNVFILIVMWALIYGLDIAADHVLDRKIQHFNIRKKDQYILTAYAFILWIIIDVVFAAAEAALNPDFYFLNYLYNYTNPIFFIGAGIMSIAVWFSLGYVLSQNTEEKKPNPQQEATDFYIKNRQTKLDIAHQIKLEKEKQKDEIYK